MFYIYLIVIHRMFKWCFLRSCALLQHVLFIVSGLETGLWIFVSPLHCGKSQTHDLDAVSCLDDVMLPLQRGSANHKLS